MGKKEDRREKYWEQKLIERVENADGMCIKISSTVVNSMPDRLVMMPGGELYLVECKRTINGVPTDLSPGQRFMHRKLHAMGIKVWLVYDTDTLNSFIRHILKLD